MSSDLKCWSSVASYASPVSVLLGNGFSINTSKLFAYSHLIDHANLAQSDRELFSELEIGDGNFEQALADLGRTATVMQHLGLDAAPVFEKRALVRDALIRAVTSVHPDSSAGPTASLHGYKEHVESLDTVFTTNYDLLLYWICASGIDFSGDDQFGDVNGVLEYIAPTVARKPPFIRYLHGALHIYANGPGSIVRKRRADGGLLLDNLRSQIDSGNTPLFVCEGTSKQKMQTIRSYDYLSDQLHALRELEGTLVIVGHSLTEGNDDHIVEAISRALAHRLDRVLVGIYPNTLSDQLELSVARSLGSAVEFFDSRCHPLFIPRIPPAEKNRVSLTLPDAVCHHGTVQSQPSATN